MPNADDLERMRTARIPKPPPEKRPMRRVSEKTRAKKDEEKKVLSSEGDTLLEQWFKARRKQLTGTCQCGCGEPSQKKNDAFFRASIAHIFPKRLFPSIMYHPLNWVERRFWAGNNGTSACHSFMDDTSMDRWANFADWPDIRERFFYLSPLLTPEEKSTKFYIKLEQLAFANP